MRGDTHSAKSVCGMGTLDEKSNAPTGAGTVIAWDTLGTVCERIWVIGRLTCQSNTEYVNMLHEPTKPIEGSADEQTRRLIRSWADALRLSLVDLKTYLIGFTCFFLIGLGHSNIQVWLLGLASSMTVSVVAGVLMHRTGSTRRLVLANEGRFAIVCELMVWATKHCCILVRNTVRAAVLLFTCGLMALVVSDWHALQKALQEASQADMTQLVWNLWNLSFVIGLLHMAIVCAFWPHEFSLPKTLRVALEPGLHRIEVSQATCSVG